MLAEGAGGGGTVTTSAGPVPAGELGLVLPHEHLLINTIRENRRTGLLHDLATMTAEVAAFIAAGGSTIVEVTSAEIAQGAAPDPLGARGAAAGDAASGTRPAANVLALVEIARRTGVRLVLGTGHYRDPYLDRDWFDRNSADAIAELLVRDLTVGFPGTDVRAGIIGEIGCEQWYISAAEERSFRAAARAHLQTGATITTHAARWPVGLDQLAILTAEGVDPGRVIIGHCDMVPLPDYHLRIAEAGAYVQFDTFHACTNSRAVQARVEAILALVGAGHLDRILLSHDLFLSDQLAATGGVGLSYIPARLPAVLAAAGLEQDQVHRLLVTNPQRALAG
jgi:phosphotriesterase-related protein